MPGTSITPPENDSLMRFHAATGRVQYVEGAKIDTDGNLTVQDLTVEGVVSLPPTFLGGGEGEGVALAYAKTANTDNGTDETVLDDDSAARLALVIVTVTTTFSDGDDGNAPVFELSVEDAATPFMAGTFLVAGAAAGESYLFVVSVPADKEIQIDATPAVTATDTNDAGAITVTVIAFPAA